LPFVENTIVTTSPSTRDEPAPDWQLTTKPRPEPQVKPVASEIIDTQTQQNQSGPADLTHPEPIRLTQSQPPSPELAPVRDSEAELTSPLILEPPPSADASQIESPAIQKLTPVVEDVPVLADKRRESETNDKSEAQSAAFKESLDEMRDEQAVLLHKADTFMEQLFANRAQPVIKPENEDESEPSFVVRNKTEEPAARLSPPTPAPRAPEPVEDRPGLVIGQLTVEVVPPQPPPAPPAPVIVVRSGGGNRSSVLSSRRFGLGQF
jgi:hypothetical protein